MLEAGIEKGDILDQVVCPFKNRKGRNRWMVAAAALQISAVLTVSTGMSLIKGAEAADPVPTGSPKPLETPVPNVTTLVRSIQTLEAIVNKTVPAPTQTPVLSPEEIDKVRRIGSDTRVAKARATADVTERETEVADQRTATAIVEKEVARSIASATKEAEAKQKTLETEVAKDRRVTQTAEVPRVVRPETGEEHGTIENLVYRVSEWMGRFVRGFAENFDRLLGAAILAALVVALWVYGGRVVNRLRRP